MRPYYAFFLAFAVCACTVLAGCSENEANASPTQTRTASSTARPQEVEVQNSVTPTISPTAEHTPSPTNQPAPTSTLQLHTVREGEEMLAIALQYNITLEALVDANPDVDASLLIVGTTLVIPVAKLPPQDDDEMQGILPLSLSSAHCLPQADGGAWCFLSASNPLDVDAGSVAVQVTLTGESTEETISRQAVGLLNRLPAGGELPLAAYFPPPVPPSPQISVELLSAQGLSAAGEDYPSVMLENLQVDIRSDELLAEVIGEALLEAGPPAGEVWVLAAAYDAQGRVIGIRRWESGAALAPGAQMPFAVRVYSAGGAIVRAVVFADAQP